MAKQKEHKDLMTYLVDKYKSHLEEEAEEKSLPVCDVTEAAVTPEVDAFVDFCVKALSENQATSVEFLNSGLALRLQDSTVVPMVPAKAQVAMGGIDGFKTINEGKSGTPGQPDVDPGRSWGISQ